MVSEMLGDSKLEVREVAAVTLAGLLKGAAPPEARQLRESFQADVARFSSRRRCRTAAGAAAAGGDPCSQSWPKLDDFPFGSHRKPCSSTLVACQIGAHDP